MDTTKLIKTMEMERQALTKYNVERREQQAQKRWAALGGSPESLAKVHTGFFLSMSESEQRLLVQSVTEKSE